MNVCGTAALKSIYFGLCVAALELYHGFIYSVLWKLRPGQSVSGSPQRLNWGFSFQEQKAPLHQIAVKTEKREKFWKTTQDINMKPFKASSQLIGCRLEDRHSL